jgi:hypothetical protein
MKTIIAGTRTMTDISVMEEAIGASGFTIAEVVSGGAPGGDALGERWAEENGIPATRFPADWKRYGRKAGPIRNQAMSEYADALIAVWDGKSRGTKAMMREGRRRGLQVCVYRVDLESETIEAREMQQGLCVGWA